MSDANGEAAGYRHEPVLLAEVLEYVRPVSEEGTVVDATVGLGGHAEALLGRHPRIRLVAIDRDPAALALAGERLLKFGHRVLLIEARHEQLFEILDARGIGRIDALLADLGVSSMQLDEANRGFSFRREGPLDMRMGGTGRTAADIVNETPESELADIIYRYGEEPMSRRIAKAIVEERQRERIETTTQLAEVIRRVKKPKRNERIDPATLTFQALRIATNDELSGLEGFIETAVERLVAKGRIAVISFHSLEDRIVKRTLRKLAGTCSCPPRMPVCRCGAREIVKVLTSHPLVAADEEMERNPRSRSARMRVAERL